MTSRFLFPLGALVAGLLLTVLGSSAYAQTPTFSCPGPNGCPSIPDPHHTSIAGGPTKNGSQLAVGMSDAIAIQAPSFGDLPGNNCVTLTNGSNQSYFVPWNSPGEWSAFKAAAQAQANLPGGIYTPNSPLYGVTMAPYCCQPETVGTALQNKICGQTIPSTTSATPMGQRWIGKLGGQSSDIEYGAAQNDHYTAYASQLLGDPKIDYQVVLICQNGTWTPLNASGGQGSCTPQLGQCATPAYATNPPTNGFVTPPADLTTLCASGSIFDASGLTGGDTSNWSWICDGTPGQGNATCSALPSPPIPAKCGVAAAWGQAIYTATNEPSPSEACADGTVNSLAYFGGTTWLWSCHDSASQTTAWCSTYDPDAPKCGVALGQTYPVSSPPATSTLCAGSATPTTLWEGGNGRWYWDCTLPGYSATAGSCWAYVQQVVGPSCGSDNGGTTLPGANLCASGDTAGSVSGGSSGPWSWTCSINGETTSCSASPSGGGGSGGGATNGICGAASGASDFTAPSISLCSAGTPSAIAGTGPWTWTCLGTVTNSPLCQTNPCQFCSGTIATQGSGTTRNVNGSGCNVSGSTTWQETDTLTGNAVTATISWTDAIGAFSFGIQPGNNSAPPQYCAPCFARPTGVSNAQTKISSATGGACPNGISTGAVVTPTSAISIQ